MKSGASIKRGKFCHLCAALLLLLSVPPSSTVYPRWCEDTEKDCDGDEVCSENQCLCNISQDFLHDEKLDRCVKLSGGACKFSAENTSDFENSESETESFYETSNDELCIANSDCDEDSGTCVCKPGYEATKYGECKRGFGKSCGDGEFCNDSAFLNCNRTEQICRCAYGNTMIYDFKRKTCVSKLFQDCELVKWMEIQKECIENAECSNKFEHNDSAYSGTCECKSGFTNTTGGNCLKIPGQPCDGHEICITQFCNVSLGQCSCPSDSIFDENSKSCEALLLLPSKVGQDCGEDGSSYLNCTANAVCDDLSKKCECRGPFYETTDGECEMGDGSNNEVATSSINGKYTNTATSLTYTKNKLIIFSFIASGLVRNRSLWDKSKTMLLF